MLILGRVWVRAAASLMVIAASLVAGQVVGDALEHGVAGLALAGMLYWGAAFWWRQGFRFPGTLTPKVREGISFEQGTGWAVDLTFENPGHTATFKATYESVEGTDHVGATPGSYVNWRGYAGDAKEIAEGREARLHLCDWPNRNSPPNPMNEYNAVTYSSTGQVVHPLARLTSPGEEVQRNIRYRLQAFCKETERAVAYGIEVSGLNDSQPDVAVERLDR